MGAKSRRKGCAFEREIARALREAWPGATVRRSLQADRAYEPDVVIEGEGAPACAQHLWLELRDADTVRTLHKLAQAERDVASMVPERWPIVVWHVTRARTIHATLRLGTLLRLTYPSTPLHPAFWDTQVVTVDFEELLARLARAWPGQQVSSAA